MLKVMIVDDEPWVLEGLRTMVDWEKFGTTGLMPLSIPLPDRVSVPCNMS